MSWQASKAVNYHSRIKDRDLFRLLHYLADYADCNGRIDPAPNQDTMADFCGVTTRTVRTWINKICDSGELEQVRVGSGPGNPSAYQIHLDIPEIEGGKVEENTANASTFDSFKAEIKAEISELKAEILALKVEKVEAKGGKVEGERRKGDSFKSDDDLYVDPSFDLKVITPQPPTGYADLIWNGVKEFFNDDEPKARNVMQAQAAFSDITGIKQPYVNGNSGTYREAERNWWEPLGRMMTDCDNDLGTFRDCITQVMAIADAPDGFTVASPRSTVKTFGGVLAKRSRVVTAVTPAGQSLDDIINQALYEEAS